MTTTQAPWQVRLAQAINEGDLQGSIAITQETGTPEGYKERAVFYNTYSAQMQKQLRRARA